MNQFLEFETDFDFFLGHTSEIDTEWPRYLERFLRLLKPGVPQRVMEYGPGNGYMMGRILENAEMKKFLPFIELVMVEPSPNYRNALRERLEKIPLKSLLVHPGIREYSDLPGAEASIDIIMSNHVFCYVENFSEESGLLRRVLKPGGYLMTMLCMQDHALIRAYIDYCQKTGNPCRKHEPRSIVAELKAGGFEMEREIVRSALEFPDTLPNRMAIHHFVMFEEGNDIPPDRLVWLERYKMGNSIHVPLVDQFLILRKQ